MEDCDGPTVPAPPPGECHLWPVAVPDVDAGRDHLALLEAAEADRYARFRSAPARRTFLTSRVTQRVVAACYTGVPPGEARLDRECRRCGIGDHGRPRIRGTDRVDISVTHAAGWVVLAVVGAGAVGVDLEGIDGAVPGRSRDIDGLAATVLCPAEREVFDGLTGSARVTWFYRCWTRKEAASKVTGHGLSVPPRALEVHGDLVRVEAPPPDWPDTPIHLVDGFAPPGCALALATTVAPTRTRLFTAPIPFHQG